MLAAEMKNRSNQYDEMFVSNFHEIEQMMNGDIKQKLNHVTDYVSKSFEFSTGTLSESFFETDYSEDDAEFVSDFASSHKNGVILIMTEGMTEDEICFFTEHMRDKLKCIVYYNGDASQFQIKPGKGLTFIRTFSLKAAVNLAYKNAKNGQAIVFPKINKEFDFFGHIDTLN